MKKITIEHGGSGMGQSSWKRWGNECLVRLDLEQAHPVTRPCSGALLIGTMVHSYMEEFWNYGSTEQLEFLDEICGNPEESVQEEAWRIWRGWYELGRWEHLGQAKAVELQLEGEWLDAHIGVAPFTARLDLVVERDDGLHIIDWKTSRGFLETDFRNYPQNSYMFQRVLYTHAAIAYGLDIVGFEFEQITKTKTIKARTIPGGPPDYAEFERVRRYLSYCQERKNNYPREYLVDKCFYCPYSYNEMCTKGGEPQGGY